MSISERPYFGYLTPYSYISFSYSLNSKVTVGSLIYLEFFRGVQPAFSVYTGYKWTESISTGTSYSFKNKRFNNVGINIIAAWHGFQSFGVTDNVIGLFRGRNAYNITLRLGVNMLLKERQNQLF